MGASVMSSSGSRMGGRLGRSARRPDRTERLDMSVLSRAGALVRLGRPLNLLGIGLGVAASIKLSGPARGFDGADAAVVAGWVLLAAGGYMLDEARDSAIDARFHPARPIPSGLVSRPLAFGAGTGLLIAGATVLIFGYAGICVVGAATALVLYGY